MTNSISKQSITNESKSSSSSSSKFGLFATLGVSVAAIGISIMAIPFVLPAMRKHALPYVPATDKQIINVIKAIKTYASSSNLAIVPSAANTSRRIKLIDLGSGDGRIVFEAARRGYDATGVELNSMLCVYSLLKSFTWKRQFKPLDNVAHIYEPKFRRADFWKVDMREYDLLVVFGVQEMMKDLASKLRDEMKESALIVSCRYPISSYEHVLNLDDSLDSVWIYTKDSLSKQLAVSKKIGAEEKKKQKQDDDDDDDD